MQLSAKISVGPVSVESPTVYWTRHFCDIRQDTGSDLMSGTPLPSRLWQIYQKSYLSTVNETYHESKQLHISCNEGRMPTDPDRVLSRCW